MLVLAFHPARKRKGLESHGAVISCRHIVLGCGSAPGYVSPQAWTVRARMFAICFVLRFWCFGGMFRIKRIDEFKNAPCADPKENRRV
jgi:hypothetical protein